MTVAERTPEPDKNRPIPPAVKQRITILQQAEQHKYANAILQEWQNCSHS